MTCEKHDYKSMVINHAKTDKMIDDFVVELQNEQQKHLQHLQGVLRQRIHPDWRVLVINIFRSVGMKEDQNDIYYIIGGNVALVKEQATFEAAEQDLVETVGILELLQQTSNVLNFQMLKQSEADEAKFPNNGVFVIDLKAAIEKESAHERLG